MTTPHSDSPASSTGSPWLKHYYFGRAAFSVLWVAAAVAVGKDVPAAAGFLLVAYPAWDAAANWLDAVRHGGLKKNPTQALNLAVSVVTSLAVVAALGIGMDAVLSVFGAWAILAGLFQLITAVRRWSTHGAQWAMVLSGAQSALAGGFFIRQAAGPHSAGILDIAPYAAFGAFYFLVSAVWLAVADWRRGR